mmetsp:Transcript_14958/g.34547  ORF Transcript_14958/g.34547 Transcript_14958/m.34547 type:complete len:239 (-) Transcript_14958:275-991(-)
MGSRAPVRLLLRRRAHREQHDGRLLHHALRTRPRRCRHHRLALRTHEHLCACDRRVPLGQDEQEVRLPRPPRRAVRLPHVRGHHALHLQPHGDDRDRHPDAHHVLRRRAGLRGLHFRRRALRQARSHWFGLGRCRRGRQHRRGLLGLYFPLPRLHAAAGLPYDHLVRRDLFGPRHPVRLHQGAARPLLLAPPHARAEGLDRQGPEGDQGPHHRPGGPRRDQSERLKRAGGRGVAIELC